MNLKDLWPFRRKGDALSSIVMLGSNAQTAAVIDQEAYLKAYEIVLWVNVCVSRIARATASVPLQLFDVKKEEEITDHPLLTALREVNPEENWSWLCGGTIGYRLLSGNAYWRLGMMGGKPASMMNLRPDRVKPKATSKGIVGWTHTVGNSEEFIPAEEVVHFKRWSPTQDILGAAALRPAELSINADTQVRNFNYSFMKNGAIPSVALVANSQLSPDQATKIAAAWEAKYGGSGNANKVAVLGSDIRLEKLGDPGGRAEGSYITLAKLMREEILAAFGVPPAVAGLWEFSSVLANAKEQRQQFWRDRILDDEIVDLLGVLNERFVPKYKDSRTLELRADESQVTALQEDRTALYARLTAATGGPWMLPNEARQEAGLDESPLLEYAVPTPTAAATGEPDLDDEASEENVPAPAKQTTPPKLLRTSPVAQVRGSLVGEFGSDAHKAHFAGFLSRTTPQIMAMAGTVGGLNVSLLAETIANLEKYGAQIGLGLTVPDFRQKAIIEDVLFDLDEAGNVYVKGLMPHATEAFESGAERGLAELGGGTWSMDRPEARAWIANKDFVLRTLPKTIYKELRAILSASTQQGLTVQEVVTQVQALEPGYKTWMAQRVARTEVISANNAGSFDSYKANGVEMKEWSTAEDEDVRDSHIEVHGDVVPLNEPFLVGSSEMMHPGDPNGGPEEIINCRCAVVPVVS